MLSTTCHADEVISEEQLVMHDVTCSLLCNILGYEYMKELKQ